MEWQSDMNHANEYKYKKIKGIETEYRGIFRSIQRELDNGESSVFLISSGIYQHGITSSSVYEKVFTVLDYYGYEIVFWESEGTSFINV